MKVLRATFLIARVAALVCVLRALTRGGAAAAPLTVSAAATDAAARARQRISVVVPARDESGRIGPLLHTLALMKQSGDVDEVIVVDDGSTDDTAALAVASGARVVSAGGLPSGWLGKPWAIDQGVAAATGEWIVTLDADTRPAPALADAAVDRCVADGIDLLTLAPAIECPTAGAAWLHPSMLTTLVYRFGRPGTVVDPSHLLANGQCMVFRRDWFTSGGGFGDARSATEEDVAFARLAARRGDRVAFLPAAELIGVRAYEGFADTRRGWGRSIGLVSVHRPLRRTIDVGVLACTMPLPWLRLFTGRADVIDVIALVVRLGTLAGTAKNYPLVTSSGRAAYWASPLADGVAWWAVATASRPMERSWRGRIVPGSIRQDG